MKRNSFLKLGLALGSLMAAPFTMYASIKNRNRDEKGFKVDAGKDRFDKSISPFEGDNF